MNYEQRRIIDNKWHAALNNFNAPGTGEFRFWMYEAKHMAYEVMRLIGLFEAERTGHLPTLHKQCSQSHAEILQDNHLTCCLGIECRKCEYLLALEKAELTPTEIDEIKTWTCCAHIVGEAAQRHVDTSEGYILTEGDKMFWDHVYTNLGEPNV
jgi:hypothetical protein